MPNSEEEKTAEKRDKRLSAVFSHYFLIFSSCAFSQLKSKDLRTEHSLERFPDVFDRDRLQAVLLLHIIAHVRRDDAAPESQPCDLRQALIQMAHGADLAGQADLTDGGQIAADRQILIARRDRKDYRQMYASQLDSEKPARFSSTASSSMARL